MKNTRKHPPAEEDVLGAFLKWLKENGLGEYAVSAKPDKEIRDARVYDFECTEVVSGRVIAIELSTAWRRDVAGREDNDWSKWCERVGGRSKGRVKGEYHVMSPIKLSRKIDAEAMAEDLVKFINSCDWAERPGRNRIVELQGVKLFVSHFDHEGDHLEFARMAPKDPVPEFATFITEIVMSKDEQLAVAKKKGLPTYLVVYNTCWTLFDEEMLQKVAAVLPSASCRNVDQFIVVHGNVPDDCWLYELDLPKD